MEYTALVDGKNPHWNALLEHVRELNSKLAELANFYLGNNVMSRLKDDNALPKATSSIASACLEVTDATCVTMATMRSIILKHNSELMANRDTNHVSVDRSKTMLNFQNHHTPESTLHADTTDIIKTEGILQHMEVALSLSKLKNELEIVNLLEHAISMIKRKSNKKRNSTSDCGNSNIDQRNVKHTKGDIDQS